MPLNFVSQFLKDNPVAAILILVWSMFWKGKALWRAARDRDLYWFVAILIINTVGILEIIYLYIFSKKPSAEKSE